MIKNRVKFSILICVSVFLFIFYYNYEFFIFLILLLLSGAFCIAVAGRYKRGIEVDILSEKNMLSKGTPMKVKIQFKNRSVWPILQLQANITVKNCFYPEKRERHFISVAVSGRSFEQIELEIMENSCGQVDISIEDIAVFDYFRLSKWKLKENYDFQYIVLPKQRKIELTEIGTDIAESDNDEYTMRKYGQESMEVADIRPYIPGDRLQRIHWKLSAKQDDWMVKEYQIVQEREITLVAELYNGEEGVLDQLLDGFFSLCGSLLDLERDFTFMWYNDRTGQMSSILIASQEERLEVVKQLYLLQGSKNPVSAYENYTGEKSSGHHITFYLGCIQGEDIIKGQKLGMVGNKVVLACI